MAAPNDRSNFHVLIIGAGSVGLLIAQRLKSLEIKCTVFERENFLNERSRDWSYGLYWAQGWLRECLPDALHGRLNAAQVDPTRSPSPSDNLRLLNGKTAEQFTRVPTPNLYRLRRSQFRVLLAEGINVQVLHPFLHDIKCQSAFAMYLSNVYCSMARDSPPSPKTLTQKMQQSQQPLRTAPRLQVTS